MIRQEIGRYTSFVLEADDMVVVTGALAEYGAFLETLGFEKHPETGEYVGVGALLYAISPSDFFDRFSTQPGGEADLTAQATDGTAFYQIDGLPLVEERDGQQKISKIFALNMETRAFIDAGVGNFRVG